MLCLPVPHLAFRFCFFYLVLDLAMHIPLSPPRHYFPNHSIKFEFSSLLNENNEGAELCPFSTLLSQGIFSTGTS